MIGRWQFHIDSVRLLPSRRNEYPIALRYALKGDFDIIIDAIAKNGDSCEVSVPVLFSGDSERMGVYAPAYEYGDEDEDGYSGEYFADFQIVAVSEKLQLLTRDLFAAFEGIFISPDKWKGRVSLQFLEYYGTARCIE